MKKLTNRLAGPPDKRWPQLKGLMYPHHSKCPTLSLVGMVVLIFSKTEPFKRIQIILCPKSSKSYQMKYLVMFMDGPRFARPPTSQCTGTLSTPGQAYTRLCCGTLRVTHFATFTTHAFPRVPQGAPCFALCTPWHRCVCAGLYTSSGTFAQTFQGRFVAFSTRSATV